MHQGRGMGGRIEMSATVAPGARQGRLIAVRRYFEDSFSFREYEAGGEMEAV